MSSVKGSAGIGTLIFVFVFILQDSRGGYRLQTHIYRFMLSVNREQVDNNFWIVKIFAMRTLRILSNEQLILNNLNQIKLLRKSVNINTKNIFF